MGSIPLLAFTALAYNILAFMSEGTLQAVLWNITLMSGAMWAFTVSDLLLSLSLILLYVEIFKSTRTSAASIVDHLLSMLVFIVCLIEFMAIPRLSKSTFFLIMLMSFLDVIAGFTVTITAARRDIGVEEKAFR